MLEKIDFKPPKISKTKKASQARIPRDPVVATRLGNNPEPELKETSQNLVVLIASDLCIAQASKNLLGPRPKTGSSFRTDFATIIVASNEGLTSLFDSPSLVGRKPPINCPEIKKKR